MNIIDRFFLKRLTKGLNPNQATGMIPINNGQIVIDYDKGKYVDAYNQNADIYAIVSFLARKAASIPLYVYKKKTGTKSKVALKRYQQLTKGIKNSGAYERALVERKSAYDENAIDESSALAKLIQNPNPNQSQDMFLENLFGYRFLSGEGFVWGNAGGIENGKYSELFILPSQYMELVTDPNDLYGYLGWILSVGGMNTRLMKSDVINWHSWNPNFDTQTRDHLRGVSPIRAAWNLYLMGKEGQKAAAQLYKNGGAKGALVPKADLNISIEQASQMQMALTNRINGNDNAGNVAMLQKSFDYLNFGMNASELQIIQAMQYSLEQWCRVFSMPSILMSPENSSYNNYDNALKDLVTNTIVPMLSQLRDELNEWLVPRMGDTSLFIDFDISALPEMQKDMERLVNSLSRADWLTMDEKRIAMGYEPKMGAYDYSYVSQGLIPIEQAGLDLGANMDQIQAMNKNDYPL